MISYFFRYLVGDYHSTCSPPNYLVHAVGEVMGEPVGFKTKLHEYQKRALTYTFGVCILFLQVDEAD